MQISAETILLTMFLILLLMDSSIVLLYCNAYQKNVKMYKKLRERTTMQKIQRVLATATLTGAAFTSIIPSALAEELPLLQTEDDVKWTPFTDVIGTKYSLMLYVILKSYSCFVFMLIIFSLEAT
jgi:hypothetical protein